MFCPNCGNDCKDAKFCIKCGTKIQSEEVTQSPDAVWSVGMPCPHCGGTQLEGCNCAYCGAQLLSGRTSIKSLVKEPVKKNIEEVNLQDYCIKYAPNRPEATKALRRDTGIGIREAKKIIDRAFDNYLGEDSQSLEVIRKASKDAWKIFLEKE